jgi:cytoskeleton protein RodZ
VTEHPSDAGVAPVAPLSAGGQLRAAREAAGMSIDAVAQQLKLAPRQVKALEDGDYTQLPGRTFVRGFIRNYARLLRLEPDAVLGALPAATVAPTLESPALHPTAPTIGELPTAEPSRHGWTRWAIPLTLVAIVAATAAWEWLHPSSERRFGATRDLPRAAATAEVGDTPLPNPVVTQPATAGAGPNDADIAPVPSAAVAGARPSPEPSPAQAPPAPLAEGRLELAFRDYSWTEVKERGGRVLLAQMNAGGTTQTVTGSPPIEVVIGNAADATLTWRGKRVELAPHTRQNVARLTLE